MRLALALVGCSLLLPGLALADAAAEAAKLDALNAKRVDPAVEKELQAAADAALASYPNDYGVLWRAARNKVWIADGLTGDLKKQFGKEGWEIGERAIKANPNGIEGQYFTAAGIGTYSQGVGILKALTEGLEGKFNEHLDLALKMDPTFQHCAPLIAKGRYYYELPWPKRDLGKSAERLNTAIARCPESLRAYAYLVQTQLKDGEAKKAKDTLDKVPAEGSYNPAEAQRALGLLKNERAEVEKALK